MLQSGHTIDLIASKAPKGESYNLVSNDYRLLPTKPVVDGEPVYEDKLDDGARATSDDVRRKAYWAVLAGAMGHTYGHNDVWPFWVPGESLRSDQRNYWVDSLQAQGAVQMRHLRRLIESRPFLNLAPDQSLLGSRPATGKSHIQAARETGGAYAFVYAPTGDAFEVNMDRIAGGAVQSCWFNPRDGTATPIGQFPNSGIIGFTPPGEPGIGNDWVLILDGGARNACAQVGKQCVCALLPNDIGDTNETATESESKAVDDDK